MPARKPASLSTRHAARSERAARKAAEAARKPATEITVKAPVALKGHAHAAATWKRLIGLYLETEGKIVTAFDQGMLIKYCLAEEELLELAKLRDEVKKFWVKYTAVLARLSPRGNELKDYYNALAQANALLQRWQGLDARLDSKRKYILSLEQSLYLTPRSRAGVAPAEKEPEEPQDDMERLLGE